MKKIFSLFIAFACALCVFASAPAGVEMVDLGLSVKWANMNVGATAPEEYGLYFAWGETQGYTDDTNNGRSFDWASYKWMTPGQSSYIDVNKYTFADGQTSCCWYDNGNFVGDNKTVLDAEDDAAHINWGSDWRMPTDAEWTELRTNCTWTWTQVNNVNGYAVSASNGNSIFLPAAGYCCSMGPGASGTEGGYWSTSLDSGYSDYAYDVNFISDGVSMDGHLRSSGRSVRPVSAEPVYTNNVITYTASEKLPEATYGSLFGLQADAFNVSITSHTFSDGIGTITFSGDVTSIGHRAFFYCRGLISVTIPNSVTSIGNAAFSNCPFLASFTIPENVTSIENGAFDKCSALTSITIPNSVTNIGDYVFRDCPSLATIIVESGNPNYDSRNNCNAIIETTSNTLIAGCQNTVIPNSVTGIGDYAFYGCSALTSLTIPRSVMTIGNSAFRSCPSLTTIVVESGNTNYDSRNNCNAIIETASNTLIFGCQNTDIPNSVTSIGNYAFFRCTSLTSLDIPNSITSIGNYAFYECSGLTSITIPNSVTNIGNYVFENCISLTSVTLPNSITSIGKYVFRSCSALTSLSIPNSVTSIGDYAFSYCSSLTSFIIPNSMRSLGEGAFAHCSSITSVFIPKFLTNIGIFAFSQCPSLTSIVVESGNTVYDSRNNCNAIIQTATNTLFTGCQSTVIPSSVTSIREYAFYGSSFSSIIIPNSINSIGYDAFSQCPNLTSITIPQSVTSIEQYTFYECSSLASIIIPQSVASIGAFVFYGCSSLTSITCEATTPPTCKGSSWFYNVDKSIPVYVPAGSVTAYQSAVGWREFTNIQTIGSNNYASVPYSCGFESDEEITDFWVFGNSGINDWNIGSATNNGGSRSLYISNDGGSSTSYSNYSSCVSVTYLPFEVTSAGYYTISFDYKCAGESSYDYMLGFVAAESAGVPASKSSSNTISWSGSTISHTTSSYPTGVQPLTGSANSSYPKAFNSTSSWRTVTNLVTLSGSGHYNLVFVWKNDGSDGSNPAICVDNVDIHRAATYTITFVNYDGTTLQEIEVEEGRMPIYIDEAPVKADDVDSIYTFAGWDKEVVVATEDVTYKATYTATAVADLHCVYFTNPNNWSSVGCYIWDGDNQIFGSWPGKSATKFGDVYRVVTPVGATPNDNWMIIWNNDGDGSQTGDMKYVDGATYDMYGVVDGGKYCGPNLTWEFDEETGTLTIEGTGDMDEWGFSISVPWSSFSTSIHSVLLPSGVTGIGRYAFYFCDNLTSITCEATTPPTCGSSCFLDVDMSIPLYVPCESVDAYRAAEGWSEFTNIIAIDCPARLEIPITAGQWHYIAFPVEVDGADIEYAGNGTWGYYDGARRATGVSGWQSVDPETTPLHANQGYIFYGDQDGTLYVNIDPATLPSGNQSIALTDYPSFHADNENWNFVGNPYYATYNVSNVAPNGMNLYVWNGTGYYAKTAGHDSYDLQPLEAFFVQKKNTENSVNFAAASAGAAAPARAWAANSNRYIDIAAVAGGYTDYTRVVLNETASEDYTVGYDLAKFFSDEAPIQLFTLDAQSIECGVQELPNGVEEIALGYTVLESGEVVVSATDMEDTYYLYDAETGITTDLRQSSYTFMAEAGTTVNRLSLRRAPGTATGVDGVNKYVNTITKVIREGHVLIQRGDRLFDLRGQEVK